jgi:PII-like signaling protein
VSEENLQAWQAVPARKLTVFLVEEDSHDHQPLYKSIQLLFQEAGIAGTTMFRGTSGFGVRRTVHTTRVEALSLSLPITIEAIDEPEKIDALALRVASLLGSGLVEVSRTSILKPVKPEGQLEKVSS